MPSLDKAKIRQAIFDIDSSLKTEDAEELARIDRLIDAHSTGNASHRKFQDIVMLKTGALLVRDKVKKAMESVNPLLAAGVSSIRVESQSINFRAPGSSGSAGKSGSSGPSNEFQDRLDAIMQEPEGPMFSGGG
jgi:hypothetical protein